MARRDMLGHTGQAHSLNRTMPTLQPGRLMPEGFSPRSACGLCDAPLAGAPVHIDFPDIPVMRCRACGFLQPAWLMTGAAIDAYYQQEFASDWHRRGQELNSVINAAALARLVDLKSVRTILDVGAGYGYLLKRLRDRLGIEGAGVEPSVREAHWGREHLGVRLITGRLEQSGLEPSSFDAVGCFEVIEHVPQPRGFVAEMARCCRPGGLVIIGTDNFESAAVRRLGPGFPKWIPHSHISDFGPDTLRRCLESVPGLEVERTLSFTPWETGLRAALARFRRAPAPAECFDLAAERGREMNRTYRLWPLRLAMDRAWFALTWRRNLAGSIMLIAARKA